MTALVQHAEERHAPQDGQLLCYRSGRPITYRRYDGLWVRIGRLGRCLLGDEKSLRGGRWI